MEHHAGLSEKHECNVYLKREDLQVVRSYKLRGAYNMMSSLTRAELDRGVICASAGNHAQGFAYSCKKLNARGIVFMPLITPAQKINQTRLFGGSFVEIRLTGDNYDECAAAAKRYGDNHGMTEIPAFNDPLIIEGQGTVGMEILDEHPNPDFVFVPVGGGGLAAGVGSYCKLYSPKTKIIGVNPEGAPAMYQAFKKGRPVILDKFETFVDGAAVKTVGELTYSICRDVVDEMCIIPDGKICSTILKLYNDDAIVTEPAGAMALSALDEFSDVIRGKNIVCIISGGNNDIGRMPEIKERSLQYEGLKHYFLIRFAQRPGALKEFVSNVLGPNDDITRFEYIKKTNKEAAPALVGIELCRKEDYDFLLARLKKSGFQFTELKSGEEVTQYIV